MVLFDFTQRPTFGGTLALSVLSHKLYMGVNCFSISALDLKNAPGSVYEGPPKEGKAGCTLTLSDDDFMGFVSGSLNPQKVSQSVLWCSSLL